MIRVSTLASSPSKRLLIATSCGLRLRRARGFLLRESCFDWLIRRAIIIKNDYLTHERFISLILVPVILALNISSSSMHSLNIDGTTGTTTVMVPRCFRHGMPSSTTLKSAGVMFGWTSCMQLEIGSNCEPAPVHVSNCTVCQERPGYHASLGVIRAKVVWTTQYEPQRKLTR